MPVIYFPYAYCTYILIFLLLLLCRAVTPKLLAYEAEPLPVGTLGYVDYKY